MTKVLSIVNRFNIGGITYNVTFITSFLDEKYETKLIGGSHEQSEGDSLYIVKEYNVEPTIIKSMQRNPNIISDFKAFLEIRKIIKEFKPDIVHTHASKAGFIGRIAAFSCKTPIVIHTFHGHVFHSYFGKIKTSIILLLEKILASKSTGIIAVSELQKNELSEKYKICRSNKIRVIGYGFDLSKFNNDLEYNRKKNREIYKISDNEIAIAIIGRVTAIKNHNFFLDVIEQTLKSTSKKIKIFIVGDGDLMPEIKNRTKYLNDLYGEKIILTSWIKDIAKFNPAMDIICLTSDNEGAPISLIEAQASEVSIISTNVGGVKNVMIDKESGFIVQKGDLKDYIEKLGYLIENDEIRKIMGKKGWDFVKNKFHYSNLVYEIDKYYQELIEINAKNKK